MPTLDAKLALAMSGEHVLASVTRLDLRHGGIDNARGLDALESLTRLDLGDNALSSTAPLAAATALTWLSLANNNLSGVEGLNSLASLTSLRILNVGGNRLESLHGIPSPSLVALIANDNALTTLDSVARCTGLNTLVVSGNPIEHIGDALLGMRGLQKASLTNNLLTSLGASFSSCTALRELKLARNKLKILPPELRANGNLRVLDLCHNKFATIADVTPLKYLTKLQNLGLAGCPVTKVKGYWDAVVAMVPSLKVLDGRKVADGPPTERRKEEEEEEVENVEVVALPKKKVKEKIGDDEGVATAAVKKSQSTKRKSELQDGEKERSGKSMRDPFTLRDEGQKKKSKSKSKSGVGDEAQLGFIQALIATNKGKVREGGFGGAVPAERRAASATVKETRRLTGVVKVETIKTPKVIGSLFGKAALDAAAGAMGGGDIGGGGGAYSGW